jgi:hypothetical protein
MKSSVERAVSLAMCLIFTCLCAAADPLGAGSVPAEETLSPEKLKKLDEILQSLKEQQQKLAPAAEAKEKLERALDLTNQMSNAFLQMLLAAKMSCDIDEKCSPTERDKMARDMERIAAETPKDQLQAALDAMLKKCSASIECSPVERRWIEREREKVK